MLRHLLLASLLCAGLAAPSVAAAGEAYCAVSTNVPDASYFDNNVFQIPTPVSWAPAVDVRFTFTCTNTTQQSYTARLGVAHAPMGPYPNARFCLIVGRKAAGVIGASIYGPDQFRLGCKQAGNLSASNLHSFEVKPGENGRRWTHDVTVYRSSLEAVQNSSGKHLAHFEVTGIQVRGSLPRLDTYDSNSTSSTCKLGELQLNLGDITALPAAKAAARMDLSQCRLTGRITMTLTAPGWNAGAIPNPDGDGMARNVGAQLELQVGTVTHNNLRNGSSIALRFPEAWSDGVQFRASLEKLGESVTPGVINIPVTISLVYQ